MKVAVRLDDITPDMDWERFFKFKELLDQYQVKPLIGVVPDNRDDNLIKEPKSDKAPQNFWTYIKVLEKEGWTVAMHGYRHVYTTSAGGVFPLNNFSEFAGLTYEKQKEMLSEGKSMLEERGIKTDIFMAPAHSYDKNTLKALKETGFQKVTDGFGNGPYLWKGITFYPISFWLGGTLKKEKGYSTMVVHTDTITEEDMNRYQNYFKLENVKWISYREYLQQPVVKKMLPEKWLEWFMAKGKYLIGRIR